MIRQQEDHATAGGQYLYRALCRGAAGKAGSLLGRLLAACAMYHHGPGLPDVIRPDGTAKLHERLQKSEAEAHTTEAACNLPPDLQHDINTILFSNAFIKETAAALHNLTAFNIGLAARFLSSCLIDADRRSSAEFNCGIPFNLETAVKKAPWRLFRERLETRLDRFPALGTMNALRRFVSDRCAQYALKKSGIYALTAATGAGKTLAALRYALVHAEKYHKERIFFIAPYNAILDQIAAVIRSILDPHGKNGELLLEHHSNLDQSEISEYYLDASQTWNVPVIVTSMVQFLNTLFASGTRNIRRMHQLSNAVIVLDEIQALPVHCTYLFNGAIQFITQSLQTSVLLCTATQPGLDKMGDYALPLPPENRLIPDTAGHFESLRRVELVDNIKLSGWTLAEVARFMNETLTTNLLTVVNTKAQARKLYKLLKDAHPDWQIMQLTTNMCPCNRRKILAKLRRKLENKTEKCVCISTSLIEAGIDLDFDSAIRFLAGFDSIIQVCGRCNRNGLLTDANGSKIRGKTYLINIVESEEKIANLPELLYSQGITRRVLREYNKDPAQYNNTLLHPDLIAQYFHYYYKGLPEYLLKYNIMGNTGATILDLLSDNRESASEFNRIKTKKYANQKVDSTGFCQSFETAWKAFEVIHEDTTAVIVPLCI